MGRTVKFFLFVGVVRQAHHERRLSGWFDGLTTNEIIGWLDEITTNEDYRDGSTGLPRTKIIGVVRQAHHERRIEKRRMETGRKG